MATTQQQRIDAVFGAVNTREQQIFSALPGIGAAPHITLPIVSHDAPGPASGLVQNITGQLSGVHTNVIPGGVPAPQGFARVVAFFNTILQRGVSTPHVGALGAGGLPPIAHGGGIIVPSVLGGVQGFTLPPGVPNSIANRL